MEAIIHENIDITGFTTFDIPVKARYFAEYSSVKELEAIMRTQEYQQNEVLHIGGGSNLLFVHDFDGLVLHSRITGIKEYQKNEDTVFVIAGAGEQWTDVVDYSVSHGLAGMENMAGIPGEAGASPVQNVGAYGVEAKDVIHSVECYDRLSHRVVRFTNEECRFAYRDSIFKHELKGRYYVLRVSYKLRRSDTAVCLEYGSLRGLAERLGHTPTPAEVRDEVIALRDSKLPSPAIMGSAGSFFKNPVMPRGYFDSMVQARTEDKVPFYELPDDMVKVPAGWLIEHAGLKGCNIGGAVVYPKQCLVIANQGGATAASVTGLAEHIRKVVHECFGVLLHPEVNYIDTTITVEVLGSGTSKGVPEPACSCEVCRSTDPRDNRMRASVFVRTHGLNLLIDASPDLRTQLLRSVITHIDATLLTHQHYDHVGGLDDLRAFCMDADMPIYLRKNVADDLHKRLDYCFRPHPYPGVPTFDLHEIGNEPFFISGLRVIPITVMHARLPIVGYRIGRFAYITDAKTIDDTELEKLRELDVLIINALRHRQHFSHLDVNEALAIIEKLKPKRAYLTHIGHDMGLHAVETTKLPGNVELAFDGLKIKID